MKRYLVVLLCAIAVTSIAYGQVSLPIKKYQELKAGGRLGDKAFQAYIMGLGTGEVSADHLYGFERFKALGRFW
jgi:hypothetical protein